MAESAACLVRSFSQPSPTSGEEKKGNPIQRALTASVSFGRFMSESLDWEKWSAFTNNRYLEEVEKYSKPGSVAEKKAYFEAHFKRRRAAALLDQQNAAACTISETANTEDKVEGTSPLESHAPGDCYVITEYVEEEKNQSSDPVAPTSQSGNCDTSIEGNLEDAEPGGTEKGMEPLVIMGNSLELTNQLDVVSEKEDKACTKDNSAIYNSASGETTPEVSSTKLLTKGKCNLSLKPMEPVQLKDSDRTSESKRNAMDSSNKRRSYTTSLHMSINITACSDPTQQDISSGLPKIEKPRITRAPAKKYKNSVLPQTSSRASVNIFKDYSAASLAQNRRTLRHHVDSISETKTVDEKAQLPLSNYKSSNLFGNKARISTVPSSFTFKSEERAVKRREFFQMLEQKAKLKDTGKNQKQAKLKPQVTRRSKDKEFRNSIALKTGKGAEVAPLRNITKKIPIGRTCFPKIEERAAAFKVQDSNIIRPPWRLSAKSEGLKDVSSKNNRPPNHSAKCLAMKHMTENASPNLQL